MQFVTTPYVRSDPSAFTAPLDKKTGPDRPVGSPWESPPLFVNPTNMDGNGGAGLHLFFSEPGAFIQIVGSAVCAGRKSRVPVSGKTANQESSSD